MDIPSRAIDRLIESLLPKIAALRHKLHQYPETAYQEQNTRKLLLQWFEQQQVLHRFTLWPPLLGTDLVLELKGDREGTVGLRADMDGLPIQEQTQLSYASQHPGIMHACGHDGHMAVLAGTAVAASRLDLPLPTVRFIFQPGEEEVCAGAELVSAGVCNQLDRVYAFHGWPGLPKGILAAKEGVMMAAAGTFALTCRGKACHGAVPSDGKNPLLPAASIVLELERLHQQVSRDRQGVISPCSVRGGESSNGIPEIAVIKGTTRYLDEQTGEMVKQAVEEAARKGEQSWGISVDIDYQARYRLPVVNNPAETDRVFSVGQRLFPPGTCRRLEEHAMVAEDFAFYLERVPGCMFVLGLGENTPGLHTPLFDFDDDLLLPAIRMMTNLIIPE